MSPLPNGPSSPASHQTQASHQTKKQTLLHISRWRNQIDIDIPNLKPTPPKLFDNWFDLPPELNVNIVSRIHHFEILENAQYVCSDWYKVCKDPSIWKVINLFRLRESFYMSESFNGGLPGIWKICKNVVDRSDGQLVDIVIPDLRTDEILMYVADRARQLKRLDMYCCIRDDSSIKSFHKALKKFPLLEELSVDFEYLTKEAIESAGRYCPLLKTLSFYQEGSLSSSLKVNDEIGVAIGANLHELRHLKLINNTISNIGLKAILDGCHQLESLKLSMCAHIDLNRDVVKRCSKQIKHLTLPV
ncbi:putative F-box/LRR-repeat protein 9 [Rutidosis leptorrhynchoides]|uniref:putative F-box/LRR-repeat protein 9 n=1 Tax=Rutidosis leptorrhynchoides TaxID=125765 RepID=UPI003A99FB3B